jgi:hypothetical protein
MKSVLATTDHPPHHLATPAIRTLPSSLLRVCSKLLAAGAAERAVPLSAVWCV